MSGSFWGGILLTLVVVLILVIWSIRRHRDPSLQINCDDPINELMPSLSGLTLGTAVAGNKVEVYENGAFFDVLIARIRAARHSVASLISRRWAVRWGTKVGVAPRWCTVS